jgi:hypothetical protein
MTNVLAISLTSSTACTTTHGDLALATYTAASIPGVNCTGAANPDIWYSCCTNPNANNNFFERNKQTKN